MAKQMSMQMMRMYERMIQDEFNPLVKAMEERTEGLIDSIRTKVKKELGIYDLCLKEAALKEQLKEIKEKLEYYEGTGYVAGVYRHHSRIDEAVQKYMDKLNQPLLDVQEAQRLATKKLRLSGVQKDVADIFYELEKTVLEITDRTKKLPPVSEAEIASVVKKDPVKIKALKE